MGSVVHRKGTCLRDIVIKIAREKQATKTLQGLIWNNMITKKIIFQSLIQNIVLYGAEIWPMTSTDRNKIRAVELNYFRRRLKLTRDNRIRTEEVWQRMDVKCSMRRTLENKPLMVTYKGCRITDGQNNY